jgi:hypothetical protein
VIVALLWGAWAYAQEPGWTVLSPVSPEAENIEQMVVIGDPLVDQARRELIHQLEQQGFTRAERVDGYLRLRNEAAWMGEVRIYDDGWVMMKRQPVRVEAPDLGNVPEPLAWATCLVVPTGCVRLGGPMLSKRRWLGVQERTLESLKPALTGYSDRVADAATDDTLEKLPQRLEALWERGEPLNAAERPAATYAERKSALLEYWDSRTDTVWGDRVRATVETFVRAEVQTSEHAFSGEEIAHFNEQRRAQRELRLPVSGEPLPESDPR